MERTFPEKDWKLLRRLEPIALDRFCARVLEEAARRTAAPGKTSHERYLQLYGLMRERDRDLSFTFDDLRRSTAMIKLARIRALGLLSEDELSGFTRETREIVALLCGADEEQKK